MDYMTKAQKTKVKDNLEELFKVKEQKPPTKRVIQFSEIYERIKEIEMMFFHPKLNKKERDAVLFEYMALMGNLNAMLPDYNYKKEK
jgi:hypothetical protein